MELHYFAWIRERIGKDAERVTPPASVETAEQLAEWLCARGEEYRAALADRSSVKVAVNQSFAGWGTPVKQGDEVAFFPPVTGG